MITQHPDPLKRFTVVKQVVSSCTRSDKVDRRKYPFVGKLAIQLQFHVTGTFEFFEDHFVHLGARINQRRSQNGQRTTMLDVTRGSEETLWLMQRIGIHPTREDFSRR